MNLDQAVAVVGLSCRLPGAPDPEAFWRLLADGVDAVGEVPPGRPEYPDRSPRGGFLSEVDSFDAGFFGISPREAAGVDPQQRLALELSWEALEDAGIVPSRLGGVRTGVFLGAIWDDYARLVQAAGPEAVTHTTITGLSRGVLANRVSYTLGLTGPSMVVDTAQSSSLVAVRLACESLRGGGSDVALAGGVSLNLTPDGFTLARRFGALSPDGRSYTFDARANGYVRGEGGGVVVLKTLRRALADGDRVHAVIRGGAVNNDGGGETLTAPRQAAQEEVLRLAYADAGVDPALVRFVELHGTGTPVGDPVEAAALGAVLGAGRTEPLLVGSVKTNIGHLEGAAGIAGLLKAVLCLRERQVAPSLNFRTPNPAIPLAELGLRVNDELSPISADPLFAGVSSFGMGGTNCHLVLSPPPTTTRTTAGEPVAAVPVLLSGRTPAALRDQAARLDRWLGENPSTGLPDLAHALATRRTSFEHRAVVLAEDHASLHAALGAVTGSAPRPGGTAFLFTGQGSQRTGMGLELHSTFGVFADAFDEVCAALDPHLDRDLREVVATGDGLDVTAYTQPALFAFEVALHRLVEHWGVRPDFLLGHSIGEIAAAHVAGVLSLPDAATLVAARGRLMRELPAGGAMVSLQAGVEEVAPTLVAGTAVAGVNGPAATVVAGDEDAVASVAALWREKGRKTKRLRVSHAFHSPRMDPMLAAFREVAESLTYHRPRVPVVSAGDVTSPDHWVRHVRDAVLFLDGMRRLEAEGVTRFLEIGPDAVLSALGRDCLTAPAVFAPGARSGRPEARTLLGAVATLHTAGVEVDWARVLTDVGGGTGQHVALPTYAFQRERHWLSPRVARPAAPGGGEVPAERDGHEPADSAATVAGLAGVPDAERGGGEPAAGAPALVGVPDAERGGREPAEPAAGVLALAGVPDAERGGREPAEPATGVPGAQRGGREPAESAAGVLALAGVPDAERDHVLDELVRTEVAAVLEHPAPAELDLDRPFKELGFDSFLTVELRERLAARTGLPLPSSFVFDHPSGAAVIRYLRGAGDAEPTTAPAVVPDGDPIAIVGMGCRFPGDIDSPEQLWQALVEGRDVIGPFPTDRGWPTDLYDPDGTTPGKHHVRAGGFLRGAAEFDNDFFGISPREALAMDPQQRLLLETGWEALENAGIAPTTLRGTPTGVFVGTTFQDYGPRLGEGAANTEGYLMTGSTPSIASGRIAYALGLEGPALTVDTACSASLVALHLACQSLRRGESTLALAGGVTVMSTPGIFVELTRQRALSADGRCKSFSDDADGTGWSEGVGVLVLERLSDARRNGHPVLALVRGSAVNQDGASNGLTAPNGTQQQRVIRRALADGGLTAADVDVVEAHGTGTRLGDPVEAHALLATYGQDRDRPLWLGSVKSNIGHTQAAAGVAGVIKVVQALRHGLLPRTLHADRPSERIDWSAGAVSLLTEARPWPRTDRPRRAGVSSFGISGTNAHVVLEEVDEPDADPEPAHVLPLVLSAKDPVALAEQVQRLRDRPVTTGVARTLAVGRSVFEHRAVLVGDTEVTGTARQHGRTVFVFPGQGSQWAGMAVGLLDASPPFRERFAEAAEAIERHVDWSVEDVVRDGRWLDRIEVLQPVLFAVNVALAALWRSCGVEPDLVVGHSQGEIAAACVAGALDLADAARLVVLRSRLFADELVGRGAVASVALSRAEVAERLPDGLTVAGVNGPRSVTVAGPVAELEGFVASCVADGVRARVVAATVASHSPQVEPLRERLLDLLSFVSPRVGAVPVLSTVTGEVLDGSELTADYWYENCRRPVGFAEAVRTLLDSGHDVFVEVSPHPVLVMGIEETAGGTPVLAVGTTRRDDGGPARFWESAARLWVDGVPVDWGRALPPAPIVPAPTYPFRRERFWLAPPRGGVEPAASGLHATGHPFLGVEVPLADDDRTVFTGRLSSAVHPWLLDHAALATVLLPGTGLVETALAAGRRVGAPALEELTLETPLLLPEGGVAIQVVVEPPDDTGRRGVSVHSRPDGQWVRHATGTLAPHGPGEPPTPAEWPPPGAEPVDLTGWYDRLADSGYDYGPAFRGLRAAWRRGDEVFAELAPAPDTGFALHPAVLDAALHAVELGVLPRSDRTWLPFSWTGVRLWRDAAAAKVRLSPAGQDAVALQVFDRDGLPVASIGSLVRRPVSPGQLAPAPLLRLEWQPVPVGAEPSFTVLGLDGLPGVVDVPEFVVAPVRPEPGEVPEAARATAHRALGLARAWLADDRFARAKLVLLTSGAVATGPDDDVPDLAAAAVWGLIRSAEAEHPGRFVLVDADDPARLGVALGTGEPQLAIRAGEVRVPRLTRGVHAARAVEWGPDDTVLITGGTGALGRLVAGHLVDRHGVGRVLLAGRRGGPSGGALTAVACDVTNREEVRDLLVEHAVTGVVHMAGVLADGLLESLTPDQVDAVLRPKVDGAWHLHELTKDLKAFVLFSSVQGVVGGAGQANYAAANVFLDALAQHRRANGLPATSMAWGLWAEGGMEAALDDGDRDRLLRTIGMTPLSADEGVALFDDALAADHAVVVPAKLDPRGDVPAPLRGLVRRAARAEATDVSFADRLAATPEQERERALVDLVRALVGETLGHNGSVDARRGFKELGFDSLTAVDLRNRLNRATGLRLPATVVFDHPTPAELVGRLRTELFGVPEPVAEEEPAVVVGDEDLIDAMDVDDLIRLARDGT
ncbi:type I polyketide synthase [Saccharothrix obliqua]|uniref:type I polyketide synthase n=1 Tax=Saccharothrix obliqua TaxID=2861747 RepID=UPI0027E29E29|nr:type I polyketide synthase [Saccharothrix obliqua]